MRGILVLTMLGMCAALVAAPARAEPTVTTLGGDRIGTPETAAQWVAACGDLAGSPFEAGREGRGVADDKSIFLEAALTTCEEALRQNPESDAVATWLGRVYLVVNRAADAVPLLEAATAAGNPYAYLLLSDVLFEPYHYGLQEEGDYERALNLRELAALSGFAEAEVAMAEALESGTDLTADLPEAYRLYALAAEDGHPFAAFKLGYNYHAGVTLAVDFAEAMRAYEAAAALGSPDALNGIAQLYEYGQGVAQDMALAIDYHLRAATLGNDRSAAELGYIYDTAQGVERDLDKAIYWLQQAADKGNGYALVSLGAHIVFGEGIEKDPVRGYEMITSAPPSIYADNLLGLLNAEGIGTDRDLFAARYHFQSAADQQNQYAKDWLPIVDAEIACAKLAGSQYEHSLFEDGRDFEAIDAPAAISTCENALALKSDSTGDKAWLARAYLAGGDAGRALPLLEEAEAADNQLARTLLGQMLRDGNNVAVDTPRALTLLETAATAQEFEPAMFAMGETYERGLGVPVDLVEAAKWYRQAASLDMPQAEERLAEISALGGSDVATAATGFGREGPVAY